MASIRLQNVTKQFGTRIVLQDITLELTSGEIVGLVGANGAGKTTLFKLVARTLEPDFGTVTTSRELEIGYLPQEPQVDLRRTLHDEAASAFVEIVALEHKLQALSDEMAARHDTATPAEMKELMEQYDRVQAKFVAADGYTMEQRLHEILGGLGFSQADYKLPVSALSGGQKCRVALARLLLQDASFLLLDEPTNHLDIDAVRWLEKFLAGHHGGAVIISHDRYLLDRVATRIVEVERSRINSYPGNYSNYAKIRAVRRLTQERDFEKHAEFIAKERDFIARHLAGQRSQQAKGRRTRLERMIADGEFVLERPSERKTLKLEFDVGETPTGEILAAEDLAKRYGEKELFSELRLLVSAGMRLGITGPNGTGKSTLLKILLGKVAPDAGVVRVAPRISIGYFTQEATDLDPNANILQEIRSVRPDFTEERTRSLLGGFLFSGDDVFKHIHQLSGGEQSRVRLLKLILASPQVLVLDEPTNHLDIPSREALEEALIDFPGTILTVSHDRYFLDRIVTRLMLIRPGQVRTFNGNYSSYIEQIERERSVEEAADDERERAAKRARDKGPAAAERSEKMPKAIAKPAAKKGPYDRLSLGELEARVHEREQRLAALTDRFADPSLARDHAGLAKLQAEFDTLSAEKAALEEAWMTRVERDAT